MLLKKMMDEGINPDNVCFYDISTLRFKYNGIEATTKKFMNDYFQYDCDGLKRNLQMLQQVSEYFVSELKEQPMKNSFNGPTEQSTPIKNPYVSEEGALYYSACSKTPEKMPSRKFY